MNESFEKDLTWNSALYLHGDEQERYEQTMQAIPFNCETLLDVGAGNGAFLHLLEQQHSKIKLSGIEYTIGGIRNKICNAKIHQGSIDKLPFDDQSVDIVSALEVIEHLPVDVYKNGLIELQRVAKMFILISVPYQENRVTVECPNCGCGFNPNTHVRSFNDEKIKNLFTDFDLLTMRAMGKKREMYFGKYRRLAKNWFGDKTFPQQCVCPQCHFSKTGQQQHESNVAGNIAQPQGYMRLIKKIFFYNTPRWYLAIYERKHNLK
jgi:ubiquinone/menaquinone biosynthesis C-methylase UbiE